MISYEDALKSKLFMGVYIAIYCSLSFVDVEYPVRLMMFGILCYTSHMFWEDMTIMNKEML
ncbi:gp238 [Bacillus phage W.Ph.]|uniref:Gp238 n=1 Tax=Bacillus phage W.Ph. TaxID=764595 RepID=G9B1Y9_9CAUD|nr:gp238 [Bacillus phage W.Ph.]ADH03384.1 gp238 [Bacillus phage W.Ph.]